MTSARVVLLVVLLGACGGLGVGVVALSDQAPAEGSARRPVPAVAGGPIAVLREWDRQRAVAWAAGDRRALRALYVPGSTAGERDVSRLTRWLDAGLRVRHLETQLLRVRVIEEHPRVVRLAVTDRIARAETTDGLRLPGDATSTWRITMRRIGGEWKVAEVSR